MSQAKTSPTDLIVSLQSVLYKLCRRYSCRRALVRPRVVLERGDDLVVILRTVREDAVGASFDPPPVLFDKLRSPEAFLAAIERTVAEEAV